MASLMDMIPGGRSLSAEHMLYLGQRSPWSQSVSRVGGYIHHHEHVDEKLVVECTLRANIFCGRANIFWGKRVSG